MKCPKCKSDPSVYARVFRYEGRAKTGWALVCAQCDWRTRAYSKLKYAQREYEAILKEDQAWTSTI